MDWTRKSDGVKESLICLIIIVGIGYLLKVPTQMFTNQAFLKGGVVAFQQALMTSTGLRKTRNLDCDVLIVSATGVTSVDTLNLADKADWIAGCQYIQDLVR